MNPPVRRIESRTFANRASHSAGGFYAKRTLDVILSAGALLLTSPLLIICALLIRLDSPGPVFFRQERLGARPYRVGRELLWLPTTFKVLKLRTMWANATSEPHRRAIRRYAAGRRVSNDPLAPSKLSDDPRITRVGHILRRTSLDELPQLLNVLLGEMSLVGPRPIPLYEARQYERWQWERLHALPGITGLWQVEGRGRCTFDESVQLDITYVRHRSLLLDLKLLCRTIPAVISMRGAK